MLSSPSLLITSLLTAQALAIAIPNPFAFADNNGQWEPSTTAESGEYQTSATYGGGPESAGIYPTQEPTYAITTAPTSGTAQAVPNWETIVTWPAGCESWANPCPPGAHISGGSTAGGGKTEESYTNGFTSYTTMTNSEGVITGMPSVATVAAGVSTTLSTATTTAAAANSNSSFVIPTGPSTTTTGFVVGTTSGTGKGTVETGAAVPKRATFGNAAIVGVAGAAVVALL